MIPLNYDSYQKIMLDIKNGKLKVPFPYEYLVDEIERIKKKLPKRFDNIARFLAMSDPIIEVIFNEMGYFDKTTPKNSRGRPRFSTKLLLQVHLVAGLIGTDSYRQTQRMLNMHPDWLRALNIQKSPDHTTLSKFRHRMGQQFFDDFHDKLVEIMRDFNLFPEHIDAIIDSAPIEAYQNFAKSNAGISIDLERLEQFYNTIDFSPAVFLIEPQSQQNKGRKPQFSYEQILKFVAFEKLCGFLSRSQALLYLNAHKKVASIIGFTTRIPSLGTINRYLKQMPPIPFLMKPLVDDIVDFFETSPDYNDDDPLYFFFRHT